jgi:hypothetical protein
LHSRAVRLVSEAENQGIASATYQAANAET